MALLGQDRQPRRLRSSSYFSHIMADISVNFGCTHLRSAEVEKTAATPQFFSLLSCPLQATAPDRMLS
jgi:hypothetical protein